MKKLLLSAIIISLLVSTAGCSCEEKPPETGTPPEPGAAMELANRFCPLFYLKGDAAPVENYEPASIETFVTDAVFVAASDVSIWQKATLPWLTEFFSSDYYLDVPDLSPAAAPGVLPGYKTQYDRIAANYPSTVYTRILESTETGHTILQYWIFYYFNDWRNVHEGDWELVQIVFPGEPVETIMSRDIQPLFIACSQHQAGQRMTWDNMQELGLLEGNRPSVYVAQGSHANYFKPGQYWSILDFDDTGLSSWQKISPDNIILIDESGEDESFDWLEFQGNWGELLGFSISISELTFSQSGPSGPAWGSQGQKNKKWEQPYSWAADLPEYPAPFWSSFIPGLAEFWPKLAVFSVFSPADIHVYDGQGRHAGLDAEGRFEEGIPGAVYLTPDGTGYKTIVIPGADIADNYRIEVNGTGTGTMDIITQVPDASTSTRQYIRYADIPVTPQTTAKIDIKRVAPAEPVKPGSSFRDTSTALLVDTDGDKVFESSVRPGESSIINAQPIPTSTGTATITPSPEPTATPEEFRLMIKETEGGTTKPQAGVFLHRSGDEVSITAIPYEGWKFVQWEGDVTGTSNPITITMTDDTIIAPRFIQEQITPRIDQESTSISGSELYQLPQRTTLAQSFVPTLPFLHSVEVYLASVNDSVSNTNSIRMEITDENGTVLVSVLQPVTGSLNNWIKVEIEGGLQVNPGARLFMVLRSIDNTSYRWKYTGDVYPDGVAYVGGEEMPGDFFFRTWGSDLSLSRD